MVYCQVVALIAGRPYTELCTMDESLALNISSPIEEETPSKLKTENPILPSMFLTRRSMGPIRRHYMTQREGLIYSRLDRTRIIVSALEMGMIGLTLKEYILTGHRGRMKARCQCLLNQEYVTSRWLRCTLRFSPQTQGIICIHVVSMARLAGLRYLFLT
jgi:hypothetical protein